MQLTNKSGQSIQAAVNAWGGGAITDFVEVKDTKSATWPRSDDRGFILTIREGSSYLQFTSYFVEADADVTLNEDGAYIGKKRLPPLSISGDTEETGSTLSVLNYSEYDIQVAVNKRDEYHTSVDFYPVASADYATWKRQGRHGIVLYLKSAKEDIVHAYYVRSNSVLSYANGQIFDHSLHYGTQAVALQPLQAPARNMLSSKIVVINHSSQSIEAAINKWHDKDVSTDFFPIKKKQQEEWARESYQGYILTVYSGSDSLIHSFYVLPGTSLIYTDNGINVDLQLIEPIEVYAKKVRITNKSVEPIQVAVNAWGQETDTDPITINPQHTEQWHRSFQFDLVVSVSHVDMHDDTPYYATDSSYLEIVNAGPYHVDIISYDVVPGNIAAPLTYQTSDQNERGSANLFGKLKANKKSP